MNRIGVQSIEPGVLCSGLQQADGVKLRNTRHKADDMPEADAVRCRTGT
jgi:hypothetical protein